MLTHGVGDSTSLGRDDLLNDAAEDVRQTVQIAGGIEVLFAGGDVLQGAGGVFVTAQIDTVDGSAGVLGKFGLVNSGNSIICLLSRSIDPRISVVTGILGILCAVEASAVACQIVVIEAVGIGIATCELTGPAEMQGAELFAASPFAFKKVAESRSAIGEDHNDLIILGGHLHRLASGINASLDIGSALLIIPIKLSCAFNCLIGLIQLRSESRNGIVVVAEANDRDLIAALLQQSPCEVLCGSPDSTEIAVHAVGPVQHQHDAGPADRSLDGLVLHRHLKGDVEVVGTRIGLFHGLGEHNLAILIGHGLALRANFRVLLGGASGIHGECRDLHQAQAHYQGHEQAQCPLADGLAPGDSLARIVLCHDSFPPSIFNRN